MRRATTAKPIAHTRLTSRPNARAHRLEPVGLGAQSDLMGVSEPISTEAVLAAPAGLRAAHEELS